MALNTSSRAFAALAFAVALNAAAAAGAQPVYRCGNEYRALACTNAKTVDGADLHNAPQRVEARQSVAEQIRAANEMERNRLRNEALIRPALAGSLGPTRPALAAATAAHAGKSTRKKTNRFQSGDDRDFIAAVPGSGRKKKSGP